MPWAAQDGNASNPDMYLTVEPDNFDFADKGNWEVVQGGFIGAGFGSEATMTNSCVSTTLGVNFNSPPPPTTYFVAIPDGSALFGGTQESNNLNEVNTPVSEWLGGGEQISAVFHAVSQDWVTAGTASCYPGDVPAPVLPATDPNGQVVESDPSPGTSNPSAIVNICTGNRFVIGVDAQNNRLLCSNAMPPATKATPDTGATTSLVVNGKATTYHVCPSSSAMIGWAQQAGMLVCGQLTANGYVPGPQFGALQANQRGNTDVPEPNYPTRNMHGCDPKDQGAPLVVTGVDVANNVLVCMNASEAPRLQ